MSRAAASSVEAAAFFAYKIKNMLRNAARFYHFRLAMPKAGFLFDEVMI